jgi:altronate hydrolase
MVIPNRHPPSAAVLRLAPDDEVSVAVRPLAAGDSIGLGDLELAVLDPIPAGHKAASQAASSGGDLRDR